MNADNPNAMPGKTLQDKRQCLMIEIGRKKLLLPRVLVVEIIDRIGLAFKPGGHPDIRLFSWRGVEVPLISGRVIDPDSAQHADELEKVVIFHAVARPQELPFYAMGTAKNPRLVSVSDQDIIEITNQKKLSKAEQMCVDINGEPAVIPGVDFLEGYVREAYIRATGSATAAQNRGSV